MPAPHESPESTREPDQTSNWFRFSLKALLLATALVAVYFGGRASMRPHWFAPQPGTWRLVMTSGHERPIVLRELPDGSFALDMGSNSAMGGKYRWKSGSLIVDVPDDPRYVGLIWQRDGDELVLVAEPPGTPAGPSYLGARLEFVSADTSPATQLQVKVVPSRVQVQQQKQMEAMRAGGQAPRQQRPVVPPSPWREPPLGEWQITMPVGKQWIVKLNKLPNGNFELITGIVLGGTYQVRNDRLEVIKPRDPRLQGLAWAWEGDELVLVEETIPPPPKPRYVGARMRFLQPQGKDEQD